MRVSVNHPIHTTIMVSTRSAICNAAATGTRLWRQFWLPTNWAFLYGNRQAQPSSRDHNNSGFRWFPEEVQSIVPQLEQMDSLIQTKAQQVIRK